MKVSSSTGASLCFILLEYCGASCKAMENLLFELCCHLGVSLQTISNYQVMPLNETTWKVHLNKNKYATCDFFKNYVVLQELRRMFNHHYPLRAQHTWWSKRKPCGSIQSVARVSAFLSLSLSSSSKTCMSHCHVCDSSFTCFHYFIKLTPQCNKQSFRTVFGHCNDFSLSYLT